MFCISSSRKPTILRIFQRGGVRPTPRSSNLPSSSPFFTFKSSAKMNTVVPAQNPCHHGIVGKDDMQ